ncbi:MAG: DUF4143 domain-containing protein [Longimicrobiales bacterium]
MRPRGSLDRPEEIGGAEMEGLVAQHLRAWIAYSPDDFELAYWRTSSGVEVDFVVDGPDVFWAVEVTNSRSVRPADVRGLTSFAEDYPECTPLLLYRGSERLRVRGVRCVPVEEFLVRLTPGRGLAERL